MAKNHIIFLNIERIVPFYTNDFLSLHLKNCYPENARFSSTKQRKPQAIKLTKPNQTYTGVMYSHKFGYVSFLPVFNCVDHNKWKLVFRLL